ncbi:MAG: dihydropteroate synthase [Clostridiales bacterium]|nr:dihydropteroate synthase [Clostridiales bacterium]
MVLGRKAVIMGILNATPDSFSDGGLYATHEAAARHALNMREQGAGIIDVGGESTRPGFLPVDGGEEKRRVLPVIAALKPCLDIPISIDTSKAEVAEAALLAGASVINDQGGLQKDPRMAALAAASGAPVVVMHNPEKETPEDGDLMGDMIAFFRRSLVLGLEAGMRENQFILDPGLGFKKTPRQNFQALARLAELRCLGLPVLVGPSRKSFMGRLLDLPPAGLDGATAAAAALCVANGAHLLRVHDVRAAAQAAEIADAVMGR